MENIYGKKSCFLSIGANLGDRQYTMKKAVDLLGKLTGTEVKAVSGLYETAPWGKTDQPAFLNAVIELSTELAPEALLRSCQEIEKSLGRVRHEHWGARTIDIDILLMEDFQSDTELLKIPHPYIAERAFVLVPLREIAPDLVINGMSVEELCNQEQIKKQGIKLYIKENWC